MNNKLGVLTKILLILSAAGLIAVLYLPLWRIDLVAPQYPEGLNLTIHANGLEGNVDIINGLNHYIGMKTLHNEDFPEFKILPYLIIFFAALFTAVALVGKRNFLNLVLLLFFLFGVLAMYDFWRWEYNYGNDLDPEAAIKVPGMSYQPPLIGYKQLLNFGAYSYPDSGGWIFISAGLLLLFCVMYEWRKYRNYLRNIKFSLASVILLLLTGCNTGPEPVVAGTDHCDFCKMTITDIRYAAETVTKKGRIYKFDDIQCLISFSKKKENSTMEKANNYFADFAGGHSLIKSTDCLVLTGGNIHTPMNGNTIAFKNRDSLKKYAAQFNAAETSLEQLQQ